MTLARHLPRFRRARRELARLAEHERQPRAIIERDQLERLNRLWDHARLHTTWYAALARERRLPPRFDSLEQFAAVMPLLDKATVRQCPDDLRSRLTGPGRWHTTSGSTGTPMRFYFGHATHQRLMRYQYRFRQMWGIDLFDPVAIMMGGASARGRSARLKLAVMDRMRHRLRLTVDDLSPRTLQGLLHRVAAFRPRAIYGYARAIELLSREAAIRGLGLPSLKAVIVTSEPISPAGLQVVASAWRTPVLVEYGATECPVIAHDWPDGSFRVRDDAVLLETLPLADGRHELALTVLDQLDFPLLRYRIGDVTTRSIVRPAQGFAILGPIGGRSDDLLVSSKGRIIHPSEVDALFEALPAGAIRCYRVHQRRDGSIEATLEPGSRHDPSQLERIRHELASLTDGRSVTTRSVQAIERTAAGKLRTVSSDLGHDR